MAMSPSIHHSASDIVPFPGPSCTGADHVLPPSVDAVKYSYPGSIAYVVVLVMWYPWYRRSMRPFGSITIGALSPPLAGKPGLGCVIGPNVLPWSVDLCITTLSWPVAKPQLPVGSQILVTVLRSGP